MKILKVVLLTFVIGFFALFIYANWYPKPLSARVYKSNFKLYEFSGNPSLEHVEVAENKIKAFPGVVSSCINTQSHLASIVYKVKDCDEQRLESLIKNMPDWAFTPAIVKTTGTTKQCPFSKFGMFMQNVCYTLNVRN